jgi:hypothetical protein
MTMTYARTAVEKASSTVAKKNGHASIRRVAVTYVSAVAIGADLGSRLPRRTPMSEYRLAVEVLKWWGKA